MLYRRFGRTELQIPVFSCGGMRYQHKWQDCPESEIPKDNQENLEATIRRSLELGINHIETARGYGSSEMQLGRILPTLPRESLIVQTKVAPCKTQKEFLDTFDQSMNYLKLDYVDLFALHGINNEELLDWSLRKDGCLEAALKLKAEGRVRNVGFSTHGYLDIIERAIDCADFDYVNLHWYYIYKYNWPAVLAARSHDMGVFIISPTDKGGMLYSPTKKFVDLCAPLSPIQFNDLFCLSHPEIHTLSLGAARPSDFDEHVSALEFYDRIQELLPPIVERLDAAMIDAVGEHWFRTFMEGLPKPEVTPGTMNMPIMLWLRNLVLAYDMVEYGKMRYNLLGNGGHWFPGLNASNVRELDLTHALANSPHREIIPDYLAQTHEMLAGEAKKRLSKS